MSLRFIALNKADAATLSVSPTENTTYPIANLKTILRSEVLRTTGLTSQQLRAVWATNQTIGAVALCQHNLTAAATWRVRLYSDVAFTTNIYDSGTVTAYDSTEIGTLDAITDASFIGFKNSVVWFTAVTTAKSMTIDLNDSGNADGYLKAARLFAGPYDQLTKNFAWGYTLTPVSPTTQSVTLGGSRLSQYNGPVTRSLDLPFDRVPAADKSYLFDLCRTKELGGDVFLSAWPGSAGKLERDHQMWAKITAMQGFDHPLLNFYGTKATFGEC